MKRNKTLNILVGVNFRVTAIVSGIHSSWVDCVFYGVICAAFAFGTLTFVDDEG